MVWRIWIILQKFDMCICWNPPGRFIAGGWSQGHCTQHRLHRLHRLHWLHRPRPPRGRPQLRPAAHAEAVPGLGLEARLQLHPLDAAFLVAIWLWLSIAELLVQDPGKDLQI